MSTAAQPTGRLRRWWPGTRAPGPRPTRPADAAADATAPPARRGEVGPPSGLARLLALAPPIDVDGPRVRLGLAWAATTLALLAASPPGLAVLLSVTAMAGAGQAVGSWRRRPVRPWRPVAVIGALLLPLSALLGPAGPALVTVAVVTAAIAGRRLLGQDELRLTMAIPLLVGIPAAGLVLVRSELGPTAALVLLVTLHLWDASTYVVGSGTANRWEGHLAAAATVAAASLLVAAVLVPPFRGVSPAVLGGAIALTAPLGPYAATALLGDRRRRAPALRRLDVLVAAVPVWGVLAAFTLT